MGGGQGAADGEDLHASGYDRELQRFDARFEPACDVHVADRVLDVGCGTGWSTRAAARAAREGGALGVDVSAPSIERARELALAEGVGNVAFERGDAQLHPFAPGGVDRVISRFGTMFFHDAGAAFGNLARALRPAGRLVMMVWQSADRNAWDVALHEALAEGARPSVESAAFSLGDPSWTTGLLDAAGFVDIELTDVDEQVWYGPDVASAEAWVRSFTCTGGLLGRLGPDDAERGLDRLRTVLSAHQGDDGVWFDARAWIVTARRG